MLRSPEELGTASGGDSREFIGLYVIHFSRNTENCLLGRVIRMQAFLVTLIRKFDISHVDHHPQIKIAKTAVLVPFVLGEEYKGPQLPLRITAIRNV